MSTPGAQDGLQGSLARPFDVAIAGAGLAGGSLALQLARAGARVAVLDASQFPRDKLCGEFLSPECWAVLERLGLDEPLMRSGYHEIRRARLSTPRGRAVEAEIIGPDRRPGIGLSRRTFDGLLVNRARQAGAEVFEGARVGGPIVREGRVIGLKVRNGDPGAFEVLAKVVIAADGRHSALVQRTGRTRARSRLRPRLFGLKRHLIVNGLETTEPEGMVGLHLVGGGYGGTCRVEGGLTNLCALLPESAASRYRGDLDRLAAEVLGRNPALARLWASSTPSGGWKTVAGVRVEVSSPSLPGILYAGDCQGTVDPLAGQGMTMALLGAEVLAPFVKQAIASGVADSAIQRAYAAAWHRRFDRRIRLCRALHHALVNPALVDLSSRLGRLASRLLAACYARTRDGDA